MAEKLKRRVLVDPEGPVPQPLSEADQEAHEAASTGLEQTNEPLATKQEISSQPDAETRYTDIEILGNRYPVRQLVREIGVQKTKAIESAQAKWHNALDTPGKNILNFKQFIAQRRHNKHKERLDDVAHLPDTHRLKRRRQAKYDRANTKLQYAKDAFTARTTRMENRTKAVEDNETRRRKEYINELKGRREKALARKAIRYQLRKDGAGVLESFSVRNEILKDTPKEHLDRIGSIAAKAEIDKRIARDAGRREASIQRNHDKATRKLTEVKARAALHLEEADKAEETARVLLDQANPPRPGSLGEAKQHEAYLRAELSELPDDDPARGNLLVQVEEASEKARVIELREVPYWQNVAKKNREKAATLAHEQNGLEQILATNNQGAQESARGATDTEYQTLSDRHSERKEALDYVINGPHETEPKQTNQ